MSPTSLDPPATLRPASIPSLIRWVMRATAVCCILLLGAARSHAQSGADIGSSDAAGGHGWAIVEDTQADSTASDSPRWIVLHLPPTSGGARSSTPGVVRATGRLQRRPERLAWVGTQMFFVLPSETIITEGRRRLRRVYSMSTQRSIAGAWMYAPADGPKIEASLPGEGTLVGLAGVGDGGTKSGAGGERFAGNTAAALVRLGDHASSSAEIAAHADTWQLLVLAGRTWMDVPLPWQLPVSTAWSEVPTGVEPSAAVAAIDAEPSVVSRVMPPAEARRVTLLSTPTGIGLLVARSDATAEWWTCRVVIPPAPLQPASDSAADSTVAAPVRASATWKRETLLLSRGGRVVPTTNVVTIEGRPMSIEVSDRGDLRAWLMLADGPVEVAGKSGVGDGYHVIARDSSAGVVSVLWQVEPEAPPAPAGESTGASKRRREPPVFALYEFFASGRVVYDGAARQDGPISRREVGLIAALLGGVLMGVMVFVLKPEKPAPERLLKLLPKGSQPAGIGRRLTASIIDLGLGVILAKSMLGLEWERLAELMLVGSVREWGMLIGMTLGMTWILPSIGEWLFGRSLGKWAVDCRVVSVRLPNGQGAKQTSPATAAGSDGSLVLWQALARNALKWLPPLTLTVLMGPRTRHFADQVAGTMVVEPEPIVIDPGE